VAAPQFNFLTLACADERMADFLRALGWAEDSDSKPPHRLLQGTNGLVVAWKRGSTVTPDGDLTWS
jgi:hypothetical protein